eukprot:760593-Hanusia_phi.AAC.2
MIDELEFQGKVFKIFSNDELRKEQKQTCKSWEKLVGCLDEVPARQELNAELATARAMQAGARWILHLDSDELWFPFASGVPDLLSQPIKHANFVSEHFDGLDKQGIGHVTYQNIEAVPERSSIENAFTEATLFKCHFSSLPLTHDSMVTLQEWTSKNQNGQFFVGYDNGKSAVRLVKGVTVRGVHSFHLPEDANLKYSNYIVDIRSNRSFSRPPERMTVIVLRFPADFISTSLGGTTNIAAWVHSAILGSVEREQRSILMPMKFYVACFLTIRKIVSQKTRNEAQAWYFEQRIPSRSLVERSLKHGVCKRIVSVRNYCQTLFEDEAPRQDTVQTQGELDQGFSHELSQRRKGSEISPAVQASGITTLDKLWLLSAIINEHCS